MNKFLISSSCLSILLCISLAGRAQFFKEILNTVKQTAQGRANSKTSQTTNNTIDKVDSLGHPRTTTTNTTANSSPFDTSSNSVLGAFAKAAARNPNDTSSADLTMKALGIMTGGEGVSAADSAKAVREFQSSRGGSGIYYEYRLTTSGKKFKEIRDTTRMYFTNGGEARSEMRINMPGVESSEMINIGHLNMPKYTFSLYPESKSYGLNIIDTALLRGVSTYQVTKIGSETVAGYSCTHARMITTTGSGMFKSSSTMDIWTSTSLPGYSIYNKLSSVQGRQYGMMLALTQAGCNGVIVKFSSTEKDYSMEQVLVQAKEMNMSADLFRIPAGYTQSNENMIYHMMPKGKK